MVKNCLTLLLKNFSITENEEEGRGKDDQKHSEMQTNNNIRDKNRHQSIDRRPARESRKPEKIKDMILYNIFCDV